MHDFFFLHLIFNKNNYLWPTTVFFKLIFMKNIAFIYFFFFSTIIFGQTFVGATGEIPDDGSTTDFNLVVSGLSSTALNATHGLIKVKLNITHTYDSDLNVALISPDGTLITLFSGIGGDGDNFLNTNLVQTATNSINDGVAPFSGNFKPQQSLGNLNNNQNGNGIWKLRVVDTYPMADSGSLNNWSIQFGNNASVVPVFSTSNLPIVVINTNNILIQDEPEINATMGIINNGVGIMNNTSDVPTDYNGNITIEYRGSYSQSLPQKPYKITTKDIAFANTDVSLLGMPAEHDWCLIANYNDKVFMRNALAYKIFGEMGHYSARNQYCEVVINGIYQGVYLLMESLKRDNNRIDISKLEITENTGVNLTGGYIFKSDYWNDTDSWQLNYHPIDHPDFNVRLVYDYPKPAVITPEQKTYVQTFVNDFETALYGDNFADDALGYNAFIDTDSFIDYFIVNELSRNNDGFKKSCYFNKNKDGVNAISKIKAGPVWDFDWAWKNINECSIFAATDGSGWAHKINDCFPDNNATGWYVRLLQDVNFQNKLRCRWDDLRTTFLSETALNNYIDSTANYLNEAQARHFVKWENLGYNTGTPEMEADPTTFSGQITKFKNWIATRISWLDANIPGISTYCTLGLNNKNSDINFYPNPVKDVLHFRNNSNKGIILLTIFDATGKCVFNSNLNENIDLSALSNGIYLCKMVGKNQILKTQKIVILH